MENVVPFKIQILSIFCSAVFMIIIFQLVIKGKLREEYSILWILCTVFLLVFSFWRNGLDVIANALGIYYAPSLVFLAGMFVIIIFLVHLSVVNSSQHLQIKKLAQTLALLEKKMADKDNAGSQSDQN